MDFDVRRVDLVKMSIKKRDTKQEVITEYMDNNMYISRPKKYKYDSGESVLDIMTLDNTNWTYEHVKSRKPKDKSKQIIRVKTRNDDTWLIDLALNNPQRHVRIAAVGKLTDEDVLFKIIKTDRDNYVKKACLDRLSKLYIMGESK
ncbi:hypothetical protein [Methanobrevibacter sp.]|uniref:hypothetical protein n=1 Tax=Methanobrevibacter sp. TaxID=66852 RepID=UPI00388E34EB